METTLTSLQQKQIREVEETTSETLEVLTTESRLIRTKMLILALCNNPTLSPTAQQDPQLSENNLATLGLNSSHHLGEMVIEEDDLNIRF